MTNYDYCHDYQKTSFLLVNKKAIFYHKVYYCGFSDVAYHLLFAGGETNLFFLPQKWFQVTSSLFYPH